MSEKFEILRPFGPPIAKFSIPLRLVNKINKFVDETISDKNKSISLDVGSKLSGQVSQEIALPKEIMEDEILDLFSRFTISYVKETLNQKINHFNLIQCWVVRQFKNEYNPIHWHTGHISGAGWLKLPKSFGKVGKKKNYNPNGKINFISGKISLNEEDFEEDKEYILNLTGDSIVLEDSTLSEIWRKDWDGVLNASITLDQKHIIGHKSRKNIFYHKKNNFINFLPKSLLRPISGFRSWPHT